MHSSFPIAVPNASINKLPIGNDGEVVEHINIKRRVEHNISDNLKLRVQKTLNTNMRGKGRNMPELSKLYWCKIITAL